MGGKQEYALQVTLETRTHVDSIQEKTTANYKSVATFIYLYHHSKQSPIYIIHCRRSLRCTKEGRNSHSEVQL